MSVSQHFFAFNLFLDTLSDSTNISAYVLCILLLYFVSHTNYFLSSALNIISLTEPFNGIESVVFV